MASLSLQNVTKVYKGNVTAVKDFTMDIKDGEFIVFVGPSGCGKSTTLRMIAGLEEITSGDLYIDGEYMNDVEPKDRNLAMVFQNYALYPYLTVYENIAFGLRLRHTPKEEIDKKVHEVSKTLGIENLLQRKPKALSGGQRQRVAVGRAIVRDAKVYLFDEPLSNLDAKLRAAMRVEIIRLHKTLNTTFIYVTHDQVEAMTMGTRIVVMKDGVIQQVGTPKDIYDNPNNTFVGGFIGTPPMNFIEGRVTEDGYFVIGDHKLGVTKLRIPENKFKILDTQNYIDKPVILGIRPEDIYDTPELFEKYADSKVHIKVDVAELLGAETNIYGVLNGQTLVAKVPARVDLHMNDETDLVLNMEKCHFFDEETQQRIKR